MARVFKYVNHLNEEIDFKKRPYFADEREFRDYEYEYTIVNNAKNFKHGLSEKTLEVKLFNSTVNDRNHLYEVFNKDIYYEKSGSLWIDDYYYKCYIRGSKKTFYTQNGTAVLEFDVMSDENIWYSESKKTFFKKEASTIENSKRYNYRYPYQYSNSRNYDELNNGFGIESAFIMIIYGPCVNPSISIADHTYRLIVTLGENEYATITAKSKEKTIVLTDKTGNKTNIFSKRDKANYIFQKIPSGRCVLNWNGLFGFDLILIDERSEPAWK